MLICPFCLTIFLNDHDDGDECSHCEVGTLIVWEDYLLRMNGSFMESMARERFINDPTN